MVVSNYYNWLKHKVCDSKHLKFYNNLLDVLFNTDMRCTMEMDTVFIQHGLALRSQYFDENPGAENEIIFHKPCSVLEYLIALCIAGESIMIDEDYGDRTPLWFWLFIRNLELDNMDDGRFDYDYVMQKVAAWLDRKFTKTGKGNIVRLKDSDCRSLSFWMCFSNYLSTLI